MGCGCGQLEVLEVGCSWSGRGPGGWVCFLRLRDPGGQCNQSVWGPSDRAVSWSGDLGGRENSVNVRALEAGTVWLG